MRIEYPGTGDVPALRGLWEAAFGDSDDFLDSFFAAAFSPRRCRCVKTEGKLAAALYWFDISCRGQSMAYLYAVATDPAFRGRGICHRLMADTHALLRKEGYAGAVLVPDGEGLTRMYAGMGYRVCTAVSEFTCAAGEESILLRTIRREEYARLRRAFLPEGGAVQEGENLTFLEAQAEFFAGEEFLLAARRQADSLTGIELLGSIEAAPRILKALGLARGSFRAPGRDKPFAMFLPLEKNTEAPAYFGLAFD